jgi:hypothetical protein
MREKLGEAVGGLVVARLLERAEEALRADELQKKKKEEAAAIKRMFELAHAMPTDTILEVPEPPKPTPGLFNRIFVKDASR